MSDRVARALAFSGQQHFMPPWQSGAQGGNWPIGQIGGTPVNPGSISEYPWAVKDATGKYIFKSVGDEMIDQTNAASSRLPNMSAVPLNQGAWDNWMASLPESGNVSDRRGEQLNTVPGVVRDALRKLFSAPDRLYNLSRTNTIVPDLLESKSGLPEQLGIYNIDPYRM